jgi:hypothetical protein
MRPCEPNSGHVKSKIYAGRFIYEAFALRALIRIEKNDRD